MRAISLEAVVLLPLVACGPKGPEMATDTADSGSATTGGTTADGPPTTSGTTGGTTGPTSGATGTSEGGLDLGAPDTTTGGVPTCAATGGCNRLDLLFVIDNSEGMADEQKHLVAALPHLVSRLRALVGEDGLPVEPDVHVMVTTTDMGHPFCEHFEKDDYDPARGAPIASACPQRLERFTGFGGDPVRLDVCLDACPESQVAAPVDPYVRFDADGDNVETSGEGDRVVDALECIVPQGIDGCGFESPLESMLQALAPDAAWNSGPAPFLRPGAALAIVLVSDETDCSALDLQHFDPKNLDHPVFSQFWEDNPGQPGVKSEPTSAICWNASMTCEDTDPDLAYDSCVPEEKGVLQPVSRYTDLLVEALGVQQDKPVFMLVMTGIPASGLEDLVHRGWAQEDILPGDGDSAAKKEFDYGIGPGCSSPATGHGLPPGRIRQVCEALDVTDDPGTPADESRRRCCFESICNTDLSGGFDCLLDNLTAELGAAR